MKLYKHKRDQEIVIALTQRVFYKIDRLTIVNKLGYSELYAIETNTFQEEYEPMIYEELTGEQIDTLKRWKQQLSNSLISLTY